MSSQGNDWMEDNNFAARCPEDAEKYRRDDLYMYVVLPLPTVRDRQLISVSANHTQAAVATMDYASKLEQIISVCNMLHNFIFAGRFIIKVYDCMISAHHNVSSVIKWLLVC